MTDSSSNPTKLRKPRSLRRTVANFLIIAGALMLLYPVGTWAYTWIEQAALARRLASEYPQLDVLAQNFFEQGTADTVSSTPTTTTVADETVFPFEHDAAREAADREGRLQQHRALHEAAVEFSASVADKVGRPIGRLVIPTIGVNVVVLEGAETQDLREGPGHWPETPFPGLGGNFVISGHRTTYGAPFFRLGQLEIGDEIQLTLPYVAARYRVWRIIIVYPNETDTVRQRGVEEISLAACHPIYSAEQRLVVQALLIDYEVLQPDTTDDM